MGKFEEIAAQLATKYGTVKAGKHEGCEVALGNPPSDKKVEAVKEFTQIIFVAGKEEKGRYDIESLKSVSVLGKQEDGVDIRITFGNGETSDMLLTRRKDDSFVGTAIKMLLGKKPTSGMKEEERGEYYFHHMITFVFHMSGAKKMTPEDVAFFYDLFSKEKALNKVYDEYFTKVIAILQNKNA